MKRHSIDLFVVMLVALIGAALTIAPVDSGSARLLFALPLVLVVPGYALVAALFPARTLDTPERLLFSVGGSLAITIIGGFLLHLSPWGLRADSWVVLLSGMTCGAAVVALRRRPHRSTGATERGRSYLNPGQGILLSLAGLVVVTTLGIARIPAPAQEAQGYSLLWMLPDQGRRQVVRIGISSQEFAVARYRLQIKQDGRIVQEWTPLELKPGTQWDTTVRLPAQRPGSHTEALLYRLDAPNTVYRRVMVRGER
jgi:uncharacterized membrane protein